MKACCLRDGRPQYGGRCEECWLEGLPSIPRTDSRRLGGFPALLTVVRPASFVGTPHPAVPHSEVRYNTGRVPFDYET